MPKIEIKPETVDAAAERLAKYLKERYERCHAAGLIGDRDLAYNALDDLRVLLLAPPTPAPLLRPVAADVAALSDDALRNRYRLMRAWLIAALRGNNYDLDEDAVLHAIWPEDSVEYRAGRVGVGVLAPGAAPCGIAEHVLTYVDDVKAGKLTAQQAIDSLDFHADASGWRGEEGEERASGGGVSKVSKVLTHYGEFKEPVQVGDHVVVRDEDDNYVIPPRMALQIVEVHPEIEKVRVCPVYRAEDRFDTLYDVGFFVFRKRGSFTEVGEERCFITPQATVDSPPTPVATTAVDEWRERALKAEAACAAMRVACEDTFVAMGRLDFTDDAATAWSKLHDIVATDAGRPILDALEKAREALRVCRGRVTDVLDAIERGGTNVERFRQSVVRSDKEVIDSALAAIEALGVRAGR